MFVTPQTDDGWVTSVEPGEGNSLVIEVEFELSDHFRSLVEGRLADVVFASRSRLARLGIDVRPSTDLTPDGKKQVYREAVEHSIQLPASFSIDEEGRFNIQSHRAVYDLIGPVTLNDLRTIVSRAEGQDLLNRIQVARPVPHIVLEPGDGVITSCSMFLHRHYVVLDREASRLGQHLQAVVLDPVSTRGTSVFLEFCNHSDTPVVNPSVAGSVYKAVPISETPRHWYTVGRAAEPKTPVRGDDYDSLSKVFDQLEGEDPGTSYFDRTVAVVGDLSGLLAGEAPIAMWRRPPGMPTTKASYHSHREPEHKRPHSDKFGTKILCEIEPGAGATLFLRYFPNLFEHLDVCAAGLEGKIKRLIFRNASYEHGLFLSARDHGRLADYDALGIDVYWCNDARKHVVAHVYRGLRGYFMEHKTVEEFSSRLILAIYGSARPLPKADEQRLRQLLVNLKDFFGDSIAILTGGGPGSMQQATNIAHELDILVGANFIETVDQQTNQTAYFYQTFQGRSRHSRQRWFEVASFHIFEMGGVGTLEEVGLTFTDMKLGIIELSPLVFFGAHGDDAYWSNLRKQLRVMVGHGRAPDWLQSHVLMTNEPDAIPQFYRQTLGLG